MLNKIMLTKLIWLIQLYTDKAKIEKYYKVNLPNSQTNFSAILRQIVQADGYVKIEIGLHQNNSV